MNLAYITTLVVPAKYAPSPQGPRSDHAFIGRRVHEIKDSLLTYLLTTFPLLLVPPSQTQSFPALLELKAGVWSSEATRFLMDLFRVFVCYAHA